MQTHAVAKRALTDAGPTWTARLHAAQPVAVRNILRGPRLQNKLKIGAANDRFEQEADRVVDRVMRMPMAGPEATATTLPANPSLDAGSESIKRICAGCEEELRLKEAPGITPALSTASEGAIRGLQGGGAPLPASERTFFEPRFGQDFSGVRIHNGAAADTSARSINARAFTLGSDIAFARGQYAPGSVSGRRLLAHELTHTIQQKYDIKRQVVQRGLWSDILDGVQVGLDVAGLIPAVGIVPDLINAGVSGLRGDAVGAGLSLAAAIPGVGLVAGAGKLGAKGARAIKGAKTAKELAEAAVKKAAKEKAAREAAERAVKEKVSKEAAERALKKKIAECEGIHAAYKSLGNCRRCKANDTKEERAAKIICITGVLTGRRRYLRKRCDYVLPGSIARGSAIAERGHRQQVIQFAKMLAKCATLPTV